MCFVSLEFIAPISTSSGSLAKKKKQIFYARHIRLLIMAVATEYTSPGLLIILITPRGDFNYSSRI